MTLLRCASAIGLIVCMPSLASAQTEDVREAAPPLKASSTLVDVQGRGVGVAYLEQTPHGVLLTLHLRHTTPGIHALHIHEVGQCSRPSFESAGGHYNPGGRQHGFRDPDGPHAGDLPNIEVPGSTELFVEHLVSGVTLDPGPRSLLDNDGAAIVIHAGKDDYLTDPSGGAGERLACGVIVK